MQPLLENRIMRANYFIAGAAALFVLSGCGGGGGTSPVISDNYTVTEYATLSGLTPSKVVISPAGYVAGTEVDAKPATVSRGFAYLTASRVDFTTVGTFATVTGMSNDAIVGYTGSADPYQPFMYQNGVFTSTKLPATATNGLYNGVIRNSSGIFIVGTALVGSDIRGFYVKPDLSVVTLNPPTGVTANTYGYGLSSNGIYCGSMIDTNEQAILWSSGTTTGKALGTLGGVDSRALAVNTSGTVVGTSLVSSGDTHAFIYKSNTMTDLGTFGGTDAAAYAINSSGVVVGYAKNASGNDRAFIYKDGVMTDLNTKLPAGSGWVLTSATGITDSGKISGVGTHGGVTAAFVLTPQ